MSFTYQPDYLYEDGYETSTIRFLIGDTVNRGSLSVVDAEIEAVLGQQTIDGYETYTAALSLCDVLSNRLANRPTSESVGDASVSYGNARASYAASRLYILTHHLPHLLTSAFNIAGGRTARFANNEEGITAEAAE